MCARAKYSRLGRLPVYCRERVPLKIINTNPKLTLIPQTLLHYRPIRIILARRVTNTHRSARGGNEKPSRSGSIDRRVEASPDVNNGDLLPACAVV